MYGLGGDNRYRVVEAMNRLVEVMGELNSAMVDAEDVRSHMKHIHPRLEEKFVKVSIDFDMMGEDFRELVYMVDQLRQKGQL